MATKPKAILSTHDGREASPITKASNVLFENGQTAQDVLNDRQDAMISPVIENSSSMFKVGQGDNVDYSANVVNGAYESMVLKGKTMVNCIQEPSSKDVVLPYEFADGQYVTINDTKESGALGVELKGQTLVNLCPNRVIDYTATSDWDGFNALGQNSRAQESWRTLQDLKPNTKYFISCYVEAFNVGERQYYLLNNPNNSTVFAESLEVRATGLHKWVLTSKSELTEGVSIVLRCQNAYARGAIKIRDIMIIEYQDGMENWDIPYFEGMTSCKMPILHTVGKNLFDGKLITGKIEDNGKPNTYVSSMCMSANYTRVQPNTTYNYKWNQERNNSRVFFYDVNKNFIKKDENAIPPTGGQFTTPSNCYYILFHLAVNTEMDSYTVLITKSNDLTYEPYKSSILSLPEEVVLRSLPNGVCDTYNVQTGEYVQNIGEVMFDGSNDEDWFLNSETGFTNKRFRTIILNGKMAKHIYNAIDMQIDRIACYPNSSWNNDREGAERDSTYLSFRKNIETIGEFKQWLSQNPVTVQYPLKTPIVTKIPLSQVLKSWNTTTHIYSEIPENSLYPILSHSNPSYPVILKPSTKYSIVANSYSNSHTNSAINFNLGGATTSTTVGNRVTTITTPSALSNELLTMSGRGNKLNNVMVIEGDVVGDEPYFEGICDCKSPILSNVGKNLFDWEAHHWRLNRFQWSHGDGGLGNGNALGRAGAEWVSIKTLKLKPSQTYYTNGYISFYENDGKGLCIDRCNHTGIFTVPTNAEIACVSAIINDGVKLEYMFDPKIIISEIEMEYEPYKSNTLLCNGDKIELTEDMFEQGGVYFTKGQSFADATNNTAPDRIRLKTLLNLKPNTTYRVAIDNAYKVGVQLYNNEKSAVSDTGWVSDTTFTTKGGENAVALVIRKLSSTANISVSDFKNIKLQLSEVDKTIVLRSLDRTHTDTLNVETGEYVSYVEQVVLTGSESENWNLYHDESSAVNPRSFYVTLAQGEIAGSNQRLFLNDKYPIMKSTTQECAWYFDTNGHKIAFTDINKRFANVSEWRNYLETNPITLFYARLTPIVSTIDVQGFPFAYENGHVQLSSGSIEQSLTPKVEYSVATNRNGQIRSNQKMVERHQKQLDQLQAIVLANLVNSQYNQTLTTLKYELSRV